MLQFVFKQPNISLMKGISFLINFKLVNYGIEKIEEPVFLK